MRVVTTTLIVVIVILFLSAFVKDLWQWEPRNEVWGKRWPLEYSSFLETKDTTFKSLHNGSAKTDMLEKDPNMVILWAGYAFSKEYCQPRGHFYAVEDVRNTLRTGAPKNETEGPQHGSCWVCKSPDVPRVMNEKGIDDFYTKKWSALGSEIVNPIGCSDCHEPVTMNLRITRHTLIEAYQRQGKDITKATKDEMRSLVCAQCHVEYYFKGDNKRVTFPWDKGMTVEDIEKYYDENNFTDYTHALSKTPILKAQHPDYELYTTSIHFERGVTCADCHMPGTTVDGKAITDHHIQSPLNKIENTCGVCHSGHEAKEYVKNVTDRQNKIQEIKIMLENLLVKAHIEAKVAWEAGATKEEMDPAIKLIRKSQWRWDFAAAGNGSSFHAPLETARIISNGIEMGQEARLILSKVLFTHGVTKVEYPDISTKEKAQKYIGLDIPKLVADKNTFINTVIPDWKSKAKERETKYDTEKY
ncbi:MAG: ammonia-forming cytochrome c nitrite reductase [Bacteroidia bacterium]|nr:ammonia-forming cytochrome c nitrite reductase [Bacteroidia bacterium]